MTPPPEPPPVAAPPWLLVGAVASGGAAGAVCRYAVGRWAAGRFPAHPWLGTLAVNLLGCGLIGFLMYAAAEKGLLSPTTRAAVITGFLGGLTTFSSFGYEAVALGRSHGFGWSAAQVGLNVVGGLVLVWAGRRAGMAAFG